MYTISIIEAVKLWYDDDNSKNQQTFNLKRLVTKVTIICSNLYGTSEVAIKYLLSVYSALFY